MRLVLLNDLSQCPFTSMTIVSAALLGFSSAVIFPFCFTVYCMQIIPKQHEVND